LQVVDRIHAGKGANHEKGSDQVRSIDFKQRRSDRAARFYPAGRHLRRRAEMSYADLAPWSDFLKVVVYHVALGPRTAGYLENMQRGIMGDVPIDDLFNLHYALLGYDRTTEPNAGDANRRGFSPEYGYRETKHSVASLAGAGNASGKTKIYPGIGFNLPNTPPDDPETICQCVLRAYEAGADGVVASREYEEMTVPNLRGFGRAVRVLKKAG
jgi:hypothetical protein